MNTAQLVVLNGAKAAARAYRRWVKSPTVENQQKLFEAQHRLERFVTRLEDEEKATRDADHYHRRAEVVNIEQARANRRPR